MVAYNNDESNITDIGDITTRHMTDISRDTSTLFNKIMEYFNRDYKNISQNYSQYTKEIDRQNPSNYSCIMFSRRSDYQK